MDRIDRRILAILQDNAKISNKKIAAKVGMAPSAVLERIRKLEERGTIESYSARLDPEQMGYGLLAFIFVSTTDGCWCQPTSDAMQTIPEVLECHSIAGEDCYLVKMRAKDTQHLNRVLREKFQPIGTITSTRTTIVLETSKETLELPIDEVDP